VDGAASSAAGGGSLARRVAEAPGSERRQIVLEAVRAQIATVLGYDSAGDIDSDQALLELGFDSLTAMELRRRLRAATGLELPKTLLFDCPTPDALAVCLLDGLTGSGGSGESSVDAGSGQPPGTLTSLMREAGSRGALGEFMELLGAASRFRPTFDARSDGVEPPRPMRLATGAGRPSLVCLPTVLATAGPHIYAKFARGFHGERDLTVLGLPGYTDGEPLPATMRDAAAVHAEAIGELAGDRPPVLVGYSAGGVLAYAVAEHLVSVGVPPAGVVLIDTFGLAGHTLAEVLANVTWAMLEREELNVPVSDARLTAMAAYARLLVDWQPTDLAVPTLALQAKTTIPDLSGGLEWATAGGLAHVTVEVPGNHISLMEENVDSTAQAVQNWLLTTLDS